MSPNFNHQVLIPQENVVIPSLNNGGSLALNILNSGSVFGKVMATFGGSSIELPIPARSNFSEILYNQAVEFVVTNIGDTNVEIYWLYNGKIQQN